MTGQYYGQPYVMMPPETESIKSLVKLAGIFGIIMTIIGLAIMVWLMFVLVPVAVAGPMFWIILLAGLVPVILGLMFYLNCKKINEMIDQGQYEQAKSKTLIWMIVGIIFINMIPGIILLIAYMKFDYLINSTRGAGYMPPPPQYVAPPPPQRMCTGCGQQILANYNNCPHCGKASVGQDKQDSGSRVCTGCGQQIPASYNNCPHCGKQAGQ